MKSELRQFIAENDFLVYWQVNLNEVGWKKRTPKSGRIDRRRCQHERDSARKVHPGITPGSG